MQPAWRTKKSIGLYAVITIVACSLYIHFFHMEKDYQQILVTAAPLNTFLTSVQKIFVSAVGVKDSRNSFYISMRNKAKLSLTSSKNLLRKTICAIKPEAIQNLPIQQSPAQIRPEEIVVPFRVQYTNNTWKGKQLPLVTSHPLGQLGNVMGEYATLYALHRIYNATVMLIPQMKDELLTAFPNLSLTETVPVENINVTSLWYTVRWEGNMFNYRPYELAAAGLFGPKLFNLQGYGFEIQLFNLFYKDIKKDFTFSPKLQNQAALFLHSVRREETTDNNSSISYVGFHVRRTSYIKHVKVLFNSKLPGDTYFKLALDYYRRKLEHPVFIVASDDTTFVENSIIGKQNDVYISKGKSASEDLALLASCNHSIITWGTYGFWAGYLAGGEVVHPVDTGQKFPYRMNEKVLEELNLPNFTPIKY